MKGLLLFARLRRKKKVDFRILECPRLPFHSIVSALHNYHGNVDSAQGKGPFQPTDNRHYLICSLSATIRSSPLTPKLQQPVLNFDRILCDRDEEAQQEDHHPQRPLPSL